MQQEDIYYKKYMKYKQKYLLLQEQMGGLSGLRRIIDGKAAIIDELGKLIPDSFKDKPEIINRVNNFTISINSVSELKEIGKLIVESYINNIVKELNNKPIEEIFNKLLKGETIDIKTTIHKLCLEAINKMPDESVNISANPTLYPQLQMIRLWLAFMQTPIAYFSPFGPLNSLGANFFSSASKLIDLLAKTIDKSTLIKEVNTIFS